MSPIENILESVWAGTRQIVLGRVDFLETAAILLLEGSLGEAERREAETEAHRLAGSLGTFGMDDGSRLAREIEWQLQGSKPFEAEGVLQLSELVVALRAAVERGPAFAGPPPASAAEANEPTSAAPILIVSPDEDFARRVAEHLSAEGRPTRLAATPAEARQVAAAAGPEGVLIDATGAGGDHVALVAELAAMPGAPLVVVLADPGAGPRRSDVVRAGASYYLTAPMAPRPVAEMLARTMARAVAGSTVLAVDDDTTAIRLLRALLQPLRCSVVGVDDPRRFWDVMERYRPDLVVVDVGMPHINGLELTRMVRADEAWGRVPVVVVSAAMDHDTERSAFLAGADDVLPKPFVPADVATRIANRLERSRRQAELVEIDPVTGLPGARAVERELARLAELARRHQRPLAVGCLVVDGDGPADRDASGLARVVRRTSRPEDVLGALEDGRIVVGLYGFELAQAVERLATALESFRSQATTASAGVAVLPDDGQDGPGLVAVARARAEEARRAGGDRVAQASTPRSSPPAQVDVLVVDDDEALGPILLHALTTRGLRAEWAKDGDEAMALLVDPGTLRPSVVLLDVGLPNLDGISVLRTLAARGRLAQTRVIMVTLRSSEAEVLEALELGAFDHVAKPFSIPVLLHRVRRALDSR